MEQRQIEEAAINKYKSIDQSQLGHTLMHAQRSAFEQGAEWMEEQLEPIITEYGMNELKHMTWNSVEERLPQEGGRYWCYVKELNDGGWFSYYQWNCAYDTNARTFSDDALTGNVTHWTNLLPPPRDK